MSVLFLTQLAVTAAEEQSGLGVLALDIRAILIQSGTFLLLFIIIKKYALGRIVDTLENRRQTIQEGLDNAHKMQELSEKAAAEQEKILKKAHTKADTILSKAHEEAGSIVQEAQDKAAAKAEQMVKEAVAQIDQEVESAKKALKGEMLSLVAQASQTVLEEKVDSAKDRNLIERAIEEQS